jgi:hypothetical protein
MSPDEKEETLDPISSLLDPSSPEPSSPLALLDDEASQKKETKRILFKAGPAAARRLSRIVEGGEDKEAVGASTAILDRIGFEKGTAPLAKASSSTLPPDVLVAALLGIGKVLGLKEAEKLRNVTPDAEKGDFVEEGQEKPVDQSGKLLPPALLHSSRPSVRPSGTGEKKSKGKKSPSSPRRGKGKR